MSPKEFDAPAVQRRLQLMSQLLDDLETVGAASADRLESDRMLRHGVERILTQLVELATAINSHIAATSLGVAPEDYRSSFAQIAEAGVIAPDLAKRLAPSAGLRNILVHEYADIDLGIVATSIVTALRDYRDYCRGVARWLTSR